MRWLALLLLAACAREEPPPAPVDLHLAPIVSEPQVLSTGEEVRIVRIPSPFAPDQRMFDTACLIYRTPNTARIVCPGTDSGTDHPYGED